MSGEISAQWHDSDWDRLVHRFAAYRSKTVPEVVRAQARLICVNLAHNTQPYGADDAARAKGRNAVRGDLNKVFLGPERILEIARLGARRGHELSERMIEAVESGRSARVAELWRQQSGQSLPAADAPDPQWHRQQRNRRGKVSRKGRPMLVLSASALRAYTLTKEKLVGFAKSGWATAARALGATRGIPGWVSRNRGPGTARDATADPSYPRVVLSNTVRYIDQVLPPKERERAVHMQYQKMDRALQHQMDAELRKAA